MRHQKRKYKIGCSPSHRKALVKTLMVQVIIHEKIKTTHAKCKAVQPCLEKLITLSKADTVANRRKAFAKLGHPLSVKKLFSELGVRYKDRPGGHTRIAKMAEPRVGDNAPMSYLMLV